LPCRGATYERKTGIADGVPSICRLTNQRIVVRFLASGGNAPARPIKRSTSKFENASLIECPYDRCRIVASRQCLIRVKRDRIGPFGRCPLCP
jgi:hypothetical protein